MEKVFKAGMASAIAASFGLAGAQAHADFYAGASIGESTLEASDNLDGQDLDYEASDTAFKVFGGYMFNDFFGVEIAYIDMGALDDKVGFDGGEAGNLVIAADADVTGFAGQLVGQYPLGPVDLFAKVGMIMYDIDGDGTVTDSAGDVLFRESLSEDGNELMWGVGARYNFGQLAARIEYETIEVDDLDDAYMWSVGIEYSFGM
jgi:OmpA-OmpF porin, OOP family